MTIVERFLQLRTELDAAYEAYWAAETPSRVLEVLRVVNMLQEEIKELKKQKLQGKIEYRKPDDYTQLKEVGSSTASNLSSEVPANQPSDKPAGLDRFPVCPHSSTRHIPLETAKEFGVDQPYEVCNDCGSIIHDRPAGLGRFPIQTVPLYPYPTSAAHSPSCPCSLCNQGLPTSVVREYPRAQVAYGGDFRTVDPLSIPWMSSGKPIRAPQRFIISNPCWPVHGDPIDHGVDALRYAMDAPRLPKVSNWMYNFVSSLYIRIKNFAKGVFHGGSTDKPVG